MLFQKTPADKFSGKYQNGIETATDKDRQFLTNPENGGKKRNATVNGKHPNRGLTHKF